MGTSKKLKEQKVIDAKGGFIGLGRQKSISKNVDLGLFTKIDINVTKSIPIYAKKATVITAHPTTSYQLTGSKKKVDELVILDPKAFWGGSKYLVIVIE